MKVSSKTDKEFKHNSTVFYMLVKVASKTIKNWPGGVSALGVSVWGVSTQGGVCLGGVSLPVHAVIHPYCGQNDRQV